MREGGRLALFSGVGVLIHEGGVHLGLHVGGEKLVPRRVGDHLNKFVLGDHAIVVVIELVQGQGGELLRSDDVVRTNCSWTCPGFGGII